MKNKDLLMLALVGVGVYLFTRQQRTQQAMMYPPVYPTQPNWTTQVAQIVTAAGGLANSLFGPNGPFRNVSKEQVNQALQQEGFNTPGTPPFIAGGYGVYHNT